MSKFKIEKNVPVPTQRRGDILELAKQMQVGDSVFFEGRTQSHVHSSFQVSRMKLGIKIQVRSVDGGARAWRIA